MGTFTISLPNSDQEVVDRVARREMRSRTKQIQLIIREWAKSEVSVINTKPQAKSE